MKAQTTISSPVGRQSKGKVAVDYGDNKAFKSMDQRPAGFKSVKQSMEHSRFRRKNPYSNQFDLTSQKLITSNQIPLDDQLKLIKQMQEGKPQRSQQEVARENPIRMKHVRVCSQDLQKLPKKSPFAKSPDPRDHIKAVMVNNNIFHGDFDASLAETANLKAATELLGVQEANKLGQITEIYDRRYYQKYPKWKEKEKANELMKRKAFKQHCRSLYTQRRMKLEQSLSEARTDMENLEILGFFDRDQMMNSSVQTMAQESQVLDKDQMQFLLDQYRDKLFPHHKLGDFLPPHELTQEDIQRLMELTGKIKQGEKVYEPFAEYLKQRKIFEDRFGEWKTKKAFKRRRLSSRIEKVINVDLPAKAHMDQAVQQDQHLQSEDSIIREDSVMFSPKSGFLGGNPENTISAQTMRHPTVDQRKKVKNSSLHLDPSSLKDSSHVMRKKLSQIDSSQGGGIIDTMFSKNFETTSRDDHRSIHYAEKSIQSLHEAQKSATQPSQPSPRQPTVVTKKLKSNRILSKTHKASAASGKKQQFKLPRRSKLPLPHELQNRLGPAIENDNIKRFAKQKTPFMSRNNFSSNCSFTKMSSSAPYSPFSRDVDEIEVDPFSPIRNDDSNYISITSNRRALMSRSSMVAGQPNNKLVKQPISMQRSSVISRQKVPGPAHLSSPASAARKRRSLRTADRSMDVSPQGQSHARGGEGLALPIHSRLNSQGSPRVVPFKTGSVSGIHGAGPGWPSKSRLDAASTTSGLLNLRKLSMMEDKTAKPSRFVSNTYAQIDNLMSECNLVVPNLIGKIRETRRTNDGVIVPKGYKTKELIGKKASQYWKRQLNMNQSILKVLNENQMQQEIEQVECKRINASSLEAPPDDQKAELAGPEEDGKKAKGEEASKAGVDGELRANDDGDDFSGGSDQFDLEFGTVQLDEEYVPSVIKPLPKMDKKQMSRARQQMMPLKDMIGDAERDVMLEEENFGNKKDMRKYENQDYRIKAFLMLITATDKTKVWMPSKTVFDKKGGKFSDKVGGLGQIPGL